jgi:hypothetical protein
LPARNPGCPGFRNPNICKCVAEGRKVGPTTQKELIDTEKKAYDVELKCLHDALKKPDKDCVTWIQDRIKVVDKEIAKLKK